MSLRTDFLNLLKPETGDRFSITGTEGYNKNMDLIDAAVKKNADDITQLNSDVAPYAFTKDANIQSFLRGMKVGSKIRYISGYCILPFGWNPSYTIVKLYEYADSDSQGCLVGENKIYPISLKKGHDVIRCDDDLVPAGKYYLSIMFTI